MEETSDSRPFVFLSNRGSGVFSSALSSLGGEKYEEGNQIDLLYFDEYGGNKAPDVYKLGASLIDRRRTIPLDNKASMAAAMLEKGVEDPVVYFDVEDVPLGEESLWYVKDPMSTAGKGISVVKQSGIKDKFRPGYIIQQAVTDLLLIDEHKFTLRVYVLVCSGRLYLFESGIVVKHGATYNPDSQDPAVQYEHSGYMDENGAVKLIAAAEVEQWAGIFESLKIKIPQVFSAFENLLKYEPEDRYCLFGVDVLVRNDLSTVVIEINDRPNIVHTALINKDVNVPMIRAMAQVVLSQSLELPLENQRQFQLLGKL